MIKAISKLGLGLVFLSLILAGCSSTTEMEPAPEPAPTKEESNERGVQFPASEPEEEIAKVFYFDFDQSFLKEPARDALKKHAKKLKEEPANIQLDGYADERGTPEYNMALGERRAEAVRAFLVSQGVKQKMITTKSYGEMNPADPGSNEEAWALNRRVELSYE